MQTEQSRPDGLAGAAGSGTEDYEDEGCYRCGGKGYIVTCIDDLCRGQDECIHGDGEQPCPACCGQSPNAPAHRRRTEDSKQP